VRRGSGFKQNTVEFLRRLKETVWSVILTINGKAELDVQDAAAYQKLRRIAEEAKVSEGSRQEIEDMNAGQRRQEQNRRPGRKSWHLVNCAPVRSASARLGSARSQVQPSKVEK
jgi:hypothetical protein